jgi:pantoate--beta-alanine ligase
VREADGLAMSSRNVYLTEAERAQAPALHAGLQHAAAQARQGERDPAALRSAVLEFWRERLPLGEVDYLEFVDPDAVQPLPILDRPFLVAAAVRLGRARLIDNLLTEPAP